MKILAKVMNIFRTTFISIVAGFILAGLLAVFHCATVLMAKANLRQLLNTPEATVLEATKDRYLVTPFSLLGLLIGLVLVHWHLPAAIMIVGIGALAVFGLIAVQQLKQSSSNLRIVSTGEKIATTVSQALLASILAMLIPGREVAQILALIVTTLAGHFLCSQLSAQNTPAKWFLLAVNITVSLYLAYAFAGILGLATVAAGLLCHLYAISMVVGNMDTHVSNHIYDVAPTTLATIELALPIQFVLFICGLAG